MKIIKLKLTLLAGASLAATAARADVDIHIVGANAFRNNVYNAVTNLYGGIYSQNTTNVTGIPNSLLVSWSGFIPSVAGATRVNIFANWNGAVAGIQDLTANLNVSFLVTNTGSFSTLSAPADIAFSSAYQAGTPYTTPVLNDDTFGASPVVWIKSTNSPAGLTNVTIQQIRALIPNGGLPAYFFTGNTNNANYVYFINRDTSAGQRVIILDEANVTASPTQYKWDTVSGSYIVDSTGQSSGPNVASQLNSFPPNTTSGSAIGYTTLVDAVNVNGGSNILSYNGVFPWNGTFQKAGPSDWTPTITGQYSLWGYEHVLTKSSLSGTVFSFKTNLLNKLVISLTNSFSSIPLNALRVSRSEDGGLITP